MPISLFKLLCFAAIFDSRVHERIPIQPCKTRTLGPKPRSRHDAPISEFSWWVRALLGPLLQFLSAAQEMSEGRMPGTLRWPLWLGCLSHEMLTLRYILSYSFAEGVMTTPSTSPGSMQDVFSFMNTSLNRHSYCCVVMHRQKAPKTLNPKRFRV